MKKLLKKLATIAAAIVAAFGAFSFNTLAAQAEDSATETVMTSVLDDLQLDATFSAEAYPGKTIDQLKAAGEEYLQVIKVAESIDNELYVYIYQPSDATKEIVASKMLIGQTAGETAARVCPLKLVSSEGVFDKYLVEGIEVLPLSLRHYQITSIYRPFDSALDDAAQNGGKDTYIAVPAAQTWYVRTTEDGRREYAHTFDEVITVTDEYHGYLLLWPQMRRMQQSFFLAFTTDRKIEKLRQVEITYEGKNVVFLLQFSGDREWRTVGTFGPKYLKITEEDKGSNNASRWWFEKNYEWDRIGTVDSFLSDDNHELDSSTVEALNRVKSTASDNDTSAFVLRYLDHDVYVNIDNKYNSASYAETFEITNVALLKMTFETEGITYTMGVVDSMTTPDTDPDGGGASKEWFGGWKDAADEFERMMRLIGLAAGAVLLVALVALIIYGITKLITWARMNKFFKNNGGGGGPGTNNGGGSGG